MIPTTTSFPSARRSHLAIILSILVMLAGSLPAATIVFTGANYSNWQTDYDTAQVDVVLHPNYYAWGGGYNDLPEAAYAGFGAPFTIDFVSLGGSQVSLQSFDLGNWLNAGGATQYQVYALNDLINPLVSVTGIDVVYSTTSHPTFNVNLASTSGLRLVIGPDMYNIGVNNIVFNESTASVPEGGSNAIMLMAALAGLVALRGKISRR